MPCWLLSLSVMKTIVNVNALTVPGRALRGLAGKPSIIIRVLGAVASTKTPRRDNSRRVVEHPSLKREHTHTTTMKNTSEKSPHHRKPTGINSSPLNEARQALENAKTKFALAKAKYNRDRAEHDQQVAAAVANPKPQTKKDKRKQERAWADQRSKMNDDYFAADAAVDAAYQLVAAAKANEIAQTCKRGENLPTCEVGEIVVQKILSQYYGKECSTVLADYLQPVTGDEDLDVDMTSNGYSGPVLLTVAKSLPTKVEYQALQKQLFTVPLPELIHRAYQLIEERRSDLEYEQENASEAAQEGEAYQNRDEELNELDYISAPDIPEAVTKIMVYHVPKRGHLSEAARLLENCLQALKAVGEKAVVTDALNGFIDSLKESLGIIESI
jgi:hypothetical protein